MAEMVRHKILFPGRDCILTLLAAYLYFDQIFFEGWLVHIPEFQRSIQIEIKLSLTTLRTCLWFDLSWLVCWGKLIFWFAHCWRKMNRVQFFLKENYKWIVLHQSLWWSRKVLSVPGRGAYGNHAVCFWMSETFCSSGVKWPPLHCFSDLETEFPNSPNTTYFAQYIKCILVISINFSISTVNLGMSFGVDWRGTPLCFLCCYALWRCLTPCVITVYTHVGWLCTEIITLGLGVCTVYFTSTGKKRSQKYSWIFISLWLSVSCLHMLFSHF